MLIKSEKRKLHDLEHLIEIPTSLFLNRRLFSVRLYGNVPGYVGLGRASILWAWVWPGLLNFAIGICGLEKVLLYKSCLGWARALYIGLRLLRA
jgi:hypothetical protein